MKTVQKLLPPAKNEMTYPAGESFDLQMQWREGAAAQEALDDNARRAQDYINWFNGTWLLNYNGGRLPWDANPPAPPVAKWAFATETTDDGGAIGFEDVLIASPTGALVCDVPAFTRQPPPQTGGGSLIDKMRTAAGVVGNPTIAVVAVNSISVASDGSKWVRIG
jgi:hypothetical protein